MMKLPCPPSDAQRQGVANFAAQRGKRPFSDQNISLSGAVSNIETPDDAGCFCSDGLGRHRGQRDVKQVVFELVRDRQLGININGLVWIKTGTMVSCLGDITLSREGFLEHGFGRLVKKALTGAGVSLTKAEGRGMIYLADSGKKISIVKLKNETLFVNGNDLLAFEDSISWDITMVRKMAGLWAGGLFNVKLEGSGMVAITTPYESVTQKATPDRAVIVDRNARAVCSLTMGHDRGETSM